MYKFHTAKFKVGDRVKVPAEPHTIGTISDIYHSLGGGGILYSVAIEDGRCRLYGEKQLEPAPLPVEYHFDIHIEDNVAVVAMIATQGEKSWCHSRGHAHILHDGAVGVAQAVSYASKRMFESLDAKQENRIYLKDRKDGESC